MSKSRSKSEQMSYPVLPLRDVVVYPHMVVPLFVGREKSISALESAMDGGKQVVLVAQRNSVDENPGMDELYKVGTLATILQMLKLPDGTLKVLVEGINRVELVAEVKGDKFIIAQVEELKNLEVPSSEIEATARSTITMFEQYVNLSKKIPSEVIATVSGIEDPHRLADTIASHMTLNLEQKQEILEVPNLNGRLEHLMGLMEAEIDLFQIEQKIRGRVKKQMEKSQREYYLNEQMKAIQKELGDMDEGVSELDQLEKRVSEAGMPSAALQKVRSEMNKLKMMSPMSAEASVLRNYIDWMIGVPWKHRTRVKHNLKEAEATLDNDHYGLKEVKERILEFLAVQQRVKKLKGPVLCLVGPPGVGKTSLGESIARATGRKFVRMSLGGVRDEAEIRGHRRTYIGSLPGKLIQKLSKAGAKNPLFLLDEIDKMGMDHRGDPASALLEVLDPEQNHTFNDHTLGTRFLFECDINDFRFPPSMIDGLERI